MATRRSVRLTDEQWEKVRPHLPKAVKSPRGGRPRANDRECFEGILWVLQSGARWRDLPSEYPSPSTCWRRLCEWEADDVLIAMWYAFLDTLNERGLIDWDEVFIDGTFLPAKKGAIKSEKPSAERVRSYWWWRMVREFQSHALPRLLHLQRLRLRKKQPMGSRARKRSPR